MPGTCGSNSRTYLASYDFPDCKLTMTNEAPSLHFETPKYTYGELEAQLKAYSPDPANFPHDLPSIISIAEGIRAGRAGNVAVGGCMIKDGEVIHRDISKALAPFHRTDLHV